MTGRGRRARSASHDQASSPAAPKGPRAATLSQSPPRRSTRTNRAASQDLDDVHNEVPPKRSRRGTRQTSVESTESTNGRGSKNTRKQNQPTSTDLTPVEEVQETQSADELENDEEPMDKSVGAVSNLSGTTAQQSQSHSQQEISDLDTSMMVTFLPDLMRDSTQIIELLTPANKASASKVVGDIIRQVLNPRSSHATLLKKRGNSFEESREYFGDDGYYINNNHIIRAFSSNAQQASDVTSVSPVLQAANLAALAKKVILLQPEDQAAPDVLQNLDSVFALPFVGEMEQSRLTNETFSVGLSIRTQTAIAVLRKHEKAENFDPDEILAQIFLEIPAETSEGLTLYENAMRNGKLLGIAGFDDENLDSFNSTVTDRMEIIRTAFFNQTQALEDGDYVNFNALQENFPWVQFVSELMHWARLRFTEIRSLIQGKGGIETIIGSLQATNGDQDGSDQINLDFDPPVPNIDNNIQETEDFVPESSINTLYKGPKSVRTMMGSSQATPSNQIVSSFRTPRSIVIRPGEPSTVPARVGQGSNNETSSRDIDGTAVLSREDMFRAHKDMSKERNKENQQPPRKRTLLDRQPTAVRVEWNDDGSQATQVAETRKRPASVVEDVVEDSGSEHFEEDQRPTPARKERPLKRARSNEKDELTQAQKNNADRLRIEVDRRRFEEEHQQLEKNRRQLRREQDQQLVRTEEEEEEEVQPALKSKYAEVNQRSKLVTKFSSSAPPVQQRAPWSEAECEDLLDLIGKHGSNWSVISKLGNFHPNRGQVGLKDKARNMKVDFLRLGDDLPAGFDHVALDKKLIEKVKAAGMNPYRREGEEVGDESYDMNGEKLYPDFE